jgi:hypothetical protein
MIVQVTDPGRLAVIKQVYDLVGPGDGASAVTIVISSGDTVRAIITGGGPVRA